MNEHPVKSEAQLDADQARTLTDEIRVAVEMTWALVIEAYERRAWAALGYSSWADYCEGEFSSSRLRLPRNERTEVVAALADTGMSIREIAVATGESKSTIGRELKPAGVPNGTAAVDLSGDDLWEHWLSGGNPSTWLGLDPPMSNQEWRSALEWAKQQPLDEEWCRWIASFPGPIFEAAVELCRVMDPVAGATRENLTRVLNATAAGPE